jgi:hypothetical protein
VGLSQGEAVEMPGVSERTFSRCGDRLRGEGPEGLDRQAADQGPSAHGACPARASGREDPAPAGNAMGLHREASSRGAATAAPSQEAAAAASLMVGIMLHRPRESGRRLALRMAAGRSSFALAEAIEQHGLFCELDTDGGSHCLHTQGRGGGIGDLVFLAFFVRRARHLVGFWAALWWWYSTRIREHPGNTAAELAALPVADPGRQIDTGPVPWRRPRAWRR